MRSQNSTIFDSSEILLLNQPAVSQYIASLESALSTQLFERMPRRMLPTEAGKRLYNQALAAIETLEAIATQKIAKSELEYKPIFVESFWLVGSPQIEVPVSPLILQVDLTTL